MGQVISLMEEHQDLLASQLQVRVFINVDCPLKSPQMCLNGDITRLLLRRLSPMKPRVVLAPPPTT